MKWNTMVSTLVLGFALCTQSYGFELLDRMLGIGGCGCETKCCETKAGCGVKASCAVKPTCGCEAKPAGCAVKPTCGCDAKPAGCAVKPTCGCDAKPAGCAAKPSCGTDAGCDNGCRKARCCRPCLLERIFSCNRCNKGCGDKGCGAKAGCGAEPTCGCGAPAAAEGGEMAPMPPAPVVDPSAYVPAQRRVVHASTTLVR